MIYIHRFKIIGTSVMVYEAWEKFNGHSTMTTHPEHGRLGKVSARRLPAEIATLPIGKERSTAVNEYFAGLDQVSLSAIHSAYPHTAGLPSDRMGGIMEECGDNDKSEWKEVGE